LKFFFAQLPNISFFAEKEQKIDMNETAEAQIITNPKKKTFFFQQKSQTFIFAGEHKRT
jgi:hypothetical protein